MNVFLVVTLAVGTSAACATKGFVTESVERRVAEVRKRVVVVERSVEEVAGGSRANTARIGEVDQTAVTALETATSAGHTARVAQDTASGGVADIRALEAANRQLLFEVVITEDHDQFGFADTELPKGATARLDALVERLHAYPGGVHLEIEGHTDDTGPTAFNEKLGLERAESVRRYLHERHRLPLHKINVISYGEAKPVESNATKDGRARNRRAVVRVLGSTPQSP